MDRYELSTAIADCNAERVGAALRAGIKPSVDDLETAVRTGDLECVRLLLVKGKLAQRKGAIQSAVYSAAGAGNEAMLRLLLETHKRRDPLKLGAAMVDALRSGSLPAVKLLREHGAPLSKFNAYDVDRAHEQALLSGNMELTKYLFEQGVPGSEHQGLLPEVIQRGGSQDFIRLCLEGGADINGTTSVLCASRRYAEWTALGLAASRGDDALLELLLGWPGVAVDAPQRGPTALMRAAAHGQLSAVKRLIEAGAALDYCAPSTDGDADAEFEGGNAYSCALHAGHVQVAEYLLSAGADRASVPPSGPATTRLHEACWRGDLDAARKAIADGAALEAFWTIRLDATRLSSHEPAMVHAVEWHRVEMLELLHAAGAKLAVDYHGEAIGAALLAHAFTPGVNQAAVVARLLELGVDPDDIGTGRWSVEPALLRAARLNELETLRVLVRHPDIALDLPPSLRGKSESPLMHAARRGNLAAVRLLVEAGASIDLVCDAPDDPGWSPRDREAKYCALWIALKSGRRDVADYLLAQGADRGLVPELASTAKADLRSRLVAWSKQHDVTIDASAVMAAADFGSAFAAAFGARSLDYALDSGTDEAETFANMIEDLHGTFDPFAPTQLEVDWREDERRVLISFRLAGKPCRITCAHDGGDVLPGDFWDALNRFARKRWQREWVTCPLVDTDWCVANVPSSAARSLRQLVEEHSDALTG